MKPLHVKSASEQVAEHLRDEILARRWTGVMPGEGSLATELSVGHDTVKAALIQLENEGLLKSQGAGKRRRIHLPKNAGPLGLKVNILLYEPADASTEHIIHLKHQLEVSGHGVTFAPKTLIELNHNPERVKKLVLDNPADAWIVQAGSRPVLEWFAHSGIPAFAMFGRMTGVAITGSGPNKRQALMEAANRLLELGHRRIVLLAREERRKPYPGPDEQIFLDQLKNAGVSVGSYNLPDWENHPAGFQQCLDALFKLTPPTALLIQSGTLFYAAQHYLARHPRMELRNISVLCSDHDPTFDWCKPSVACFRHDLKPVVRRIVRWVNKVGRGEDDRRQSFTEAKFIEGETIQPV